MRELLENDRALERVTGTLKSERDAKKEIETLKKKFFREMGKTRMRDTRERHRH